ncbi:pilus assembly PilX family protein [Derxia lacustris]|uniref:pilus assembly PilX family protein n=1 Tax=Derxia lacustris TaxID=764842 RepID=UPI000A174C8F|nr:PilX N-terminal domain-containing pilus assembly protein [Derxia lacustris]
MKTRLHHGFSAKYARGIVLIISLVMLMLLTILGIIALRSATSEERIASNIRDRQLVFELAESGLRRCQDELHGNTFSRTPTPRPTGADPNNWAKPSNWTKENSAVATYSKDDADVVVQCMADEVLLLPSSAQISGGNLRETRNGYRATVKAYRKTGGATVMVQSVFPSV